LSPKIGHWHFPGPDDGAQGPIIGAQGPMTMSKNA